MEPYGHDHQGRNSETGPGSPRGIEREGQGPGTVPFAPRSPGLIVFQAGVRRLEEALKQLPALEAPAGWSGVYTVPAVRSRVCGADVREFSSGTPCILDTVKPEGLEKVLARADVLVLPTLCLMVASKVAHLMCDDPESRLVFSALLQGKQVLAAGTDLWSATCWPTRPSKRKWNGCKKIGRVWGDFLPDPAVGRDLRSYNQRLHPGKPDSQVRRSTHAGTTCLLPS